MSNISERPELRIIASRCPKCGYPRGKRDDGNQRTECAACGHVVSDAQTVSQSANTLHMGYVYTAPASPDPTACVQGCIGAEAGIPWIWIGDGYAEAIVPMGKLRVELGVDISDVQAVIRAVEEFCERVNRRTDERG